MGPNQKTNQINKHLTVPLQQIKQQSKNIVANITLCAKNNSCYQALTLAVKA